MGLKMNTCPVLITGVTDQELKQDAWDTASNALWFGNPSNYKSRMYQAVEELKTKYPNQHDQVFNVLKKFSESDFKAYFFEEEEQETE